MSEPSIVDRAVVASASALDDAWFSSGGRVIDDLAAVLGAFGVGSDDSLLATLPRIVNIGVQQTATGIIQDPAGSAVGASSLGGGGASGAIYGAFPDLRPIPAMAVGAAVFNRSSGPGRRVMHTHSPVLQGEPADPAARATALVQLADAYTNALLAASERAGELGADGAVCNLVPVAGSIFAGAFRRGRYFAVAHLDPSYTLVAIVVAIAQARADGAALPALTLCCFDRDVAERAAEVRNAFGASLAGG